MLYYIVRNDPFICLSQPPLLKRSTLLRHAHLLLLFSTLSRFDRLDRLKTSNAQSPYTLSRNFSLTSIRHTPLLRLVFHQQEVKTASDVFQ